VLDREVRLFRVNQIFFGQTAEFSGKTEFSGKASYEGFARIRRNESDFSGKCALFRANDTFARKVFVIFEAG
jgi:hypothetical protein